MTEGASRSAELRRRAKAVFAGGSPFMYDLPDEVNVVLERGRGSRVWDADGREWIDYHLGSGPLLIGHSHPGVVEAVKDQVERGSTFYYLNRPAIELAERVVEAVPCAEAVKLVSSGTEATFYALRIARAWTGRSKLLKFEGALHGGNDYATQSTVPPRRSPYPRSIPDSDGIPAATSAEVLIGEFNDLPGAERIVAGHGAELAAIIVEPMQRALAPAPGFLAGLRALAARSGALLVFDEIVTGFRLAWGGAQERYGVVPDLCTLGKAIGGGYPVAAVAGRRDVMAVTSQGRRGSGRYAWVSGTLNANPVGATAGLATLDVLARPGSFPRLHELGERLRRGIEAAGRALGLPVQALGDGPLAQVFFAPAPPRSHADVMASDAALRRRFGEELLRRGILVMPGEKLYLSLAHSDADLEATLAAAADALSAIARDRVGVDG
ncbi:MAG TPA: aspartate aminotransferase family protein [Chloroflexota bacterium]|jgi:glutamate-1-semialdehyde 2,1-aminomutase|nr:aspartate aminotransferase family protein [Chloroflexota bacterium]